MRPGSSSSFLTCLLVLGVSRPGSAQVLEALPSAPASAVTGPAPVLCIGVGAPGLGVPASLELKTLTDAPRLGALPSPSAARLSTAYAPKRRASAAAFGAADSLREVRMSLGRGPAVLETFFSGSGLNAQPLVEAAPVPAHLRDWRTFFEANRDARDLLVLRFAHHDDGSAVWDIEGQGFEGGFTYLREVLSRRFPDYPQPPNTAHALLPPPYKLREVMLQASGFELLFPRGAANRNLFGEEGYLRMLSKKRYPVMDIHDVRLHLPRLFEVRAAKLADVAGTLLGLPRAPETAKVWNDVRDLVSYMTGELDRSAAASVTKEPRVDRRLAVEAAEDLRSPAPLRMSEFTRHLEWLTGQGPFGRRLAHELKRVLLPGREEETSVSRP